MRVTRQPSATEWALESANLVTFVIYAGSHFYSVVLDCCSSFIDKGSIVQRPMLDGYLRLMRGYMALLAR